MSIETVAIIIAALVNVGVLLGGLWKLSQLASHVQHTFDYFALEHEILIQDYCERKDIAISDLPTRLPKAPWWPRKKEGR